MGTPKLRRHSACALMLVFVAVAASVAQQDPAKATQPFTPGD
jgi:hypothetical protein